MNVERNRELFFSQKLKLLGRRCLLCRSVFSSSLSVGSFLCRLLLPTSSLSLGHLGHLLHLLVLHSLSLDLRGLLYSGRFSVSHCFSRGCFRSESSAILPHLLVLH